MTAHNMAYSRGTTLIDYGLEIENEIARLQEVIEAQQSMERTYGSRWLAIKLLEEDHSIQQAVKAFDDGEQVLLKAEESIAHLRDIYGDDVDTIIADRRYGWINGLVKEVVKQSAIDHRTISDKIDTIITSRILGIPIFLALMWIVFKVTTDLSEPMLEWVEYVFTGPLSNWIAGILSWGGLSGSWIESLLVDGIIAGVGGVLVFVPVMAFLYLALALLEDSGYMARAAFVMDRLMHGLGLHGKSFLPMIVGFGCTVPALMATRTLENEKDRILTGLLVPFMSCGARLPVYVLLASIFFPRNSGMVIFWLYILGIFTAIMVGLALKNSIFKGKELAPFVMELPPYRVPTFKAIWFHMWERTSAFIRKAASIILIASVIIWLLLSIPVGAGSFADVSVNESAFASVSQGISPIFRPLGFGEWRMTGPLVTGFIAKEVVVSTMSQVHEIIEIDDQDNQTTFFEDVGEMLVGFIQAIWDTIKSIPLIIGVDLFDDNGDMEPTGLMFAVRESFDQASDGHGALASVAYMVFILLYTPCVAAIAAAKQELGTRWMWLSVIGQFFIAWVFAFIIFQGGLLLGIG